MRAPAGGTPNASESKATEAPLRRRKIAFYLPNLSGGGAELSTLRLASGLVGYGYRVDLVVDQKRGAYSDRIPARVRVIELGRGSKALARMRLCRFFPRELAGVLRPLLSWQKPHMTLRRLPSLVGYLARERPGALIAAVSYAPFLAIWAGRIAGAGTPIIVAEHNTLSARMAGLSQHGADYRRQLYKRELIGRLYPRANAIVSVSNGVADDLATSTGLDRDTITTIYNPVVAVDFDQYAAEPADHPWFSDHAPPVIVAVGRLVTQKNFRFLLEAFSVLRQQRRVRLMILGEGPQRANLARHIERLDLCGDIELTGWVDNPYALIRQASLFVLSSSFEGLPTALIEAMACGTPVVATDCPSGPREILDHGRFGKLVAVGDTTAMARAMDETLLAPGSPKKLRERAQQFSVEKSVACYRSLLARLG